MPMGHGDNAPAPAPSPNPCNEQSHTPGNDAAHGSGQHKQGPTPASGANVSDVGGKYAGSGQGAKHVEHSGGSLPSAGHSSLPSRLERVQDALPGGLFEEGYHAPSGAPSSVRRHLSPQANRGTLLAATAAAGTLSHAAFNAGRKALAPPAAAAATLTANATVSLAQSGQGDQSKATYSLANRTGRWQISLAICQGIYNRADAKSALSKLFKGSWTVLGHKFSHASLLSYPYIVGLYGSVGLVALFHPQSLTWGGRLLGRDDRGLGDPHAFFGKDTWLGVASICTLYANVGKEASDGALLYDSPATRAAMQAKDTELLNLRQQCQDLLQQLEKERQVAS
ncbi:hypothetical protein COCOBI_17-3150 [Coccomyxa sp. Obi]|nr:hypothetical protein COCOBI_17-3150 [Coccomyxa sp. Obi]